MFKLIYNKRKKKQIRTQEHHLLPNRLEKIKKYDNTLCQQSCAEQSLIFLVLYKYTYICVYICTIPHRCACMYMHFGIYACMYAYTYTKMHIQTHIHIYHIYKQHIYIYIPYIKIGLALLEGNLAISVYLPLKKLL